MQQTASNKPKKEKKHKKRDYEDLSPQNDDIGSLTEKKIKNTVFLYNFPIFH